MAGMGGRLIKIAEKIDRTNIDLKNALYIHDASHSRV